MVRKNRNPRRLASLRRRLALQRLEDRTTPSFAAPVAYPIAGTSAIASADLNNDNNEDLIANGGILFGNGDGTFIGGPTHSFNSTNRLVTADFDNDGNMDVLGYDTWNGLDFSVHLGNGDGTFAAPISSGQNTVGYTRWVSAADLNNDNVQDVIVWEAYPWYEYSATAWRLAVYIGAGDGTFTLSNSHEDWWNYYDSPYFNVLAIGDFDEDGNIDVMAPSALYFGNGDGTLTASSASPFEFSDALAGDVNGDGNLDLFNWTATALGNGDGTFSPSGAFNQAGPYYAPDVNGDGALDLIQLGDFPSYYPGRSFSVRFGDGDGGFGSEQLSKVSGLDTLAFGDWNEDGNIDVVFADADTANVYLNTGSLLALNGPTVNLSDASQIEGNSGTSAMEFTISLSAAHATPVSVQYFTSGSPNGDYDFSSGTVTFLPSETTKSVTVTIRGDAQYEHHEMFSVVLHNAEGVLVGDGTGEGTILNDDVRIRMLGAPNVVEGNSGSQTATFTVVLTGNNSGEQIPSALPVSVQYLTANGSAVAGSDYSSTGGSITFVPGETSKTFTVPVLGDQIGENNENFFANLSNPVNGVISAASGSCTIIDNEPRVSISDVNLTEGNSGTKNFVFTVTLSAAQSTPVTMSFRTVNALAKSGEDYVAATSTLNFAAGQTSKTITIQVKGDKKRETNEYFNVELYNLSNNAWFSDNFGEGMILNDD